ncbi:MAG TPA: transposase [Flavisolibacter sp.]|jgi:transposase|nr:transposase [Flavisolibacter sp.]
MQLYKEIKQKGYDGGRTAAYAHLHSYVSRAGHLMPPTLPDIFYVPSKISFLLLRKKEQLTSREQKLVADLCRTCSEINTAACFAREFKVMMENKEGHLLRRWMDQAITCGVMEIKNFAKGLQRDFIAVKNALTLPWSNGQVDGQINKIKTIKRQMYGRASFDLLRKRLLLDTS